MGRFFI